MKALLEVNPLLHRERTGIPTYVEQVFRRVLAARPDDRFLLWAPDMDRNPLPGYPNAAFRGRRLFPRAVLETLWDRSSIEAVPAELDLYHLPFPGRPAPRRRAGTRLVVTIHDLAFASHPETVMDDRYLAQLIDWFARQADEADLILADSVSTADDVHALLDYPRERIRVVYLGTDLTAPDSTRIAADTPRLRELGVPEDYVLSLGTREPRKNLPRVLEAFALLRDKSLREGLCLCLAGGARWQYQAADDLIGRLGLEEQVRLLGYVPRDLLPSLYAGARAFVYPSLYEGFGLPVLEAMACGAPVVTSTTSSLPEVAGDAALLVDPRSPEAIAAALASLLDDMALNADCKARGIARAAAFSWDRAAAETLAAYDQALAGG